MKRFELVYGGLLFLLGLLPGLASADDNSVPPESLASFFQPPEESRGDFGRYTSPLRFNDGRRVTDASVWPARRAEVLETWHDLMGRWPPLLQKPHVEYLDQTQREGFTQSRVRIETAPNWTSEGYLLTPRGDGPFPAVLVVYYEPETSVGLNDKQHCAFGYQLARRGFITLSIGSRPGSYYPTKETCRLQPLSFHAYVAANCHTALAALPQVAPERIGIMGHSYGGKWAMFASCLHDKFACGVWSDGGIVFDETRPNVNYWEPWYLGFESGVERKRGIVTPENPRTGPYREMIATGRDLHELHALMAPRPFLVSGGAEDHKGRWPALNHAIQVNELLGLKNRVAMTNRPGHSPTPESNEQAYAFLEHFLKADRRASVRAEEKIIRLGMIGLDTSHVIAFTSYLNNPKNNAGCRVVAAFPGGSPDFKASASRVDKYTAEMRDKYGIEIVNTIEELCQKVDGILLESVDGRPHLEQARIVIAAGKPLFVDKPVADDLSDVIELFRLAKEKNVPCWSSSSMRFGKEVAGAQHNEKIGKIVACDVFGSSSWAEHHPSLYLYGIHAVEPLFTVMGTGCETVRRIKTDRGDMVVGVWKGGRIGTFRDLRGGKSDFKTVIYGTEGMATGASAGYTPLLVEIDKFFQTGKPPVSAEETIEIYAFMSAADESAAQGGAAVSIAETIEKAQSK